MKKTMATRVVALVMLACAGSLQAHHSISMFDIAKPIWVKGTVLSYEVKNPHIMIALEETKADGQVQKWDVEGPILARLKRMNLDENFLKTGDVIEVCGFPFKEEVLARRSSSDTGGLALPSLHGHMLVLADGHMQPWGPYGKLDNCIRPGDHTQLWLDFLNMDSIARQLWCNSRAYVDAASLPKTSFADNVTSRMTKPCE